MMGYDDCIIRSINGVQSDLEAQEIKRSCLNKFPPVEEQKNTVEKKENS
tara:strand:+ start:11529 stop:11675 length:147 start_codon:yes stop_codon:yes gene_type:complete